MIYVLLRDDYQKKKKKNRLITWQTDKALKAGINFFFFFFL